MFIARRTGSLGCGQRIEALAVKSFDKWAFQTSLEIKYILKIK